MEENKVYRQVLAYIEEGIKCGSITTGKRLPTEREIAGVLHVSRASVREALCILDDMGIIECVRGSGNFLTGMSEKGYARLLHMDIQMGMVSRKEANHIRAIMEKDAFSQILDRQIEIDLDQMRELLEQMNIFYIPESLEAIKSFHDHIFQWGGSPLENKMNQAVSENSDALICEKLESLKEKEKRQINICHNMIFQALERRDKTLGTEAIELLYQVLDEVL